MYFFAITLFVTTVNQDRGLISFFHSTKKVFILFREVSVSLELVSFGLVRQHHIASVAKDNNDNNSHDENDVAMHQRTNVTTIQPTIVRLFCCSGKLSEIGPTTAAANINL